MKGAEAKDAALQFLSRKGYDGWKLLSMFAASLPQQVVTVALQALSEGDRTGPQELQNVPDDSSENPSSDSLCPPKTVVEPAVIEPSTIVTDNAGVLEDE